ncbi:MAG: DUF1638 domain-containing protein [Christensenellales bacterium]|jgi:hypothetical protein
MRFKLLCCKALQREVASLIYACPHVIDVTMVRQRLHDTPKQLMQALQQEIDAVDSGDDVHTDQHESRPIDAILLGYGLCSNAIAGLSSSKYPLVAPRAHDCITLLMGSRAQYDEDFRINSGTYYYTRGWYDLGALFLDDDLLRRKRQQYMDRFQDEDTVEYLMDVERDMLRNYRRMAHISWPNIPDDESIRSAQKTASTKGWRFDRYPGNDRLLRQLLWGQWDDSEFLVVPPGQRIAPSYDDRIIKAVAE